MYLFGVWVWWFGADGVDGGAFGGAFLRRVFGFPFGGWATLGLPDGFGDGGSLGG